MSGLWLGGWLLHLSFLSDFLKLVCYAHVLPCTRKQARVHYLDRGQLNNRPCQIVQDVAGADSEIIDLNLSSKQKQL